MCTITGSNDGRRLTSKILATALASPASVPSRRPSSVGNATSAPARMRSAAYATACGDVWTITIAPPVLSAAWDGGEAMRAAVRCKGEPVVDLPACRVRL
jgi:hypothetical protein